MAENTPRQRLLSALKQALLARRDVVAVWEQGSKAFGRDDADSDVDLSVAVEDDAVELVVQAVERALAAAGLKADLRWEVPQPAWHGHWQAFYRFEGFPPLLLLDLAIMKKSHPHWLCEPEAHGKRSDVWLDRDGELAKRRLDRVAHAAALRKGVERLRITTRMFHPFVEKELKRGRPIDALAFYNSLVLAKLIEALRTLHCPQRSTFGWRYLNEDLPPAVASRMERLAYVPSAAALPALKAEAVAWFEETLAQLDGMDLGRHLEEKLSV